LETTFLLYTLLLLSFEESSSFDQHTHFRFNERRIRAHTVVDATGHVIVILEGWAVHALLFICLVPGVESCGEKAGSGSRVSHHRCPKSVWEKFCHSWEAEEGYEERPTSET
jgi:hypothetical protein